MKTHLVIAIVALLLGILVGRFIEVGKSTPSHPSNNGEATTPGKNSGEKPPQAETDPPEPWSESNTPDTTSPPAILDTMPRERSGVSTGAADQSLEAAIDQQNFEAIWQLAFDLIAAGHFEQVDRLYEIFADAFHGGNLDSPLWKAPDFYSGNLMREYADNEIALLEYLAHVAQLNQPGELLSDLRIELFEGEAAPMILGFHEGRNPEVVAGWLPYYQNRIENWQGTSFRNREIILALGHIPVEESALLLMDILPWAGSSQRLDVVRALARNGTAPAIEALIGISMDDANPVLRRAASEAIKLLR